MATTTKESLYKRNNCLSKIGFEFEEIMFLMLCSYRKCSIFRMFKFLNLFSRLKKIYIYSIKCFNYKIKYEAKM